MLENSTNQSNKQVMEQYHWSKCINNTTDKDINTAPLWNSFLLSPAHYFFHSSCSQYINVQRNLSSLGGGNLFDNNLLLPSFSFFVSRMKNTSTKLHFWMNWLSEPLILMFQYIDCWRLYMCLVFHRLNLW